MASVLAFPCLVDLQWRAIAAALPAGADLAWARAALDRLVIERYRHKLKDRIVLEGALRIWAAEHGTDRFWKANPAKPKRPGSEQPKRHSPPPRGPGIDYLSVVAWEILGVELNPWTAARYLRRIGRIAGRLPITGAGSMVVEASVIAAARAAFAGTGRLTVDAVVLRAGGA